MKWLANLLFVSLFLAGTVQRGLVVRGDPRLANGCSAQVAESAPNILYAEWIGKNLLVEGERFADGATVLIDGQRLKSSNSEAYPRNFLTARKAKKKVAPDQVIKLQIQNPDGTASNEFTFYSGFVVTLSYFRKLDQFKSRGEVFIVSASERRTAHHRMVCQLHRGSDCVKSDNR